MAGKWGGTESLLSLLRVQPPPKKKNCRERTSVSCKMSLGGKGQNEEHWRASSFWTSSYSFFFFWFGPFAHCLLLDMRCLVGLFLLLCSIHTHTQRACTPEDIYNCAIFVAGWAPAAPSGYAGVGWMDARRTYIYIKKKTFGQNKSVTLPSTNERKGGCSAASYLFIAFLQKNKNKNKTSSYKFY
jgi:hypothetical protein